MKRKAAILLTAAVTLSLLSACGGSGTSAGSGSGGAGGAAGSSKSGKGEITWTWGTLRGLYGDAEVTFNEDGGRETVLMKYPNGKVYRQMEYDYNNYYSGDVNSAGGEEYISGKKVYPVSKLTKDAGGNALYSYGYEWAECSNPISQWGAGVASDITPILAAGEQQDAGKTPEEPEERYYPVYEYGYDYEAGDSTGSVSYQELSHHILSGQYESVYRYGQGYWLTERVDGNPAKTWFYAPDGRLDEDITITWNYEKDKPVSLQLGQYSMDTYTAEVSDDGRTITYTLDESHTAEGEAKDGQKAEGKELEQIYAFTLTYQEDGLPAEFQYSYNKEFMNTDSPETREYTITYHYENGVLSGAEYHVAESDKGDHLYTITCNEEGMLETEDYLVPSIGKGDIGAKAYTYYDNGFVETVTCYGDFTTEDPESIDYVKSYSEDGWLCGKTNYKNGKVTREYSYFENGEDAGQTSYNDGIPEKTYIRNENGVYTSYEEYGSGGFICRSGEMTGENEFTMYYCDADGNKYVDAVYIYGENEFEKKVYEEDGSISYTNTFPYHDGKNHQ
ncbi:MAG: hypothetical protein ACI4OO_04325 [Otoolea sp.]